MNKKARIYLIILVWTAAIVQLFINKGINREDGVIDAMAMAEVSDCEAEISVYGFYGNGYISDETKEQMLIRLAGKLGIDSGYEITKEASTDGSVSTFQKNGVEGDTKIQIITMTGTDDLGGDSYENYLSMKVVLHQKTELAGSLSRELEALYESLGMEPVLNLYAGGVTAGRLTEEEMAEKTQDFLDIMHASQVLEEQFGNVYTVYGYTSDLSDYVYQNEEKVNVNIAFSYDEEADETRIHMAVPFVDKSF